MKATIEPRLSECVSSYRKEHALRAEYVALDPETGDAVVTVRTYRPRSVCYACVWIHAKPTTHARGAGKAGGDGYCKESAAVDAAFCDAGVTLSESISDHGVWCIREAVLATARAATGKRKFIFHKAHG